MERAQMLIEGWMDKQNAYPCSGIVFISKTEWHTDTCCLVGELHKHLSEKPDTLGSIFLLYEIATIHQSVKTESRVVVASGWGDVGMGSSCLIYTGSLLWGWWKGSELSR